MKVKGKKPPQLALAPQDDMSELEKRFITEELGIFQERIKALLEKFGHEREAVTVNVHINIAKSPSI